MRRSLGTFRLVPPVSVRHGFGWTLIGSLTACVPAGWWPCHLRTRLRAGPGSGGGIGKWQISAAGDAKPRWRRDGKELVLHLARRHHDGRAGEVHGDDV